MSLDEATAIMAVHLGCVDEEAINQMSFVFFDDVFAQLGRKLNYDAIVNYAGNAFCKKSWEMIEKANPIQPGNAKGSTANAMQNLISFLGGSMMKEGKGR